MFFELIGQPETDANSYQFTSIELKQQAFRLDGVFLPLTDNPNQSIYFLEVQFQKDEAFYQRVFAEIFLYLFQYQPINDWRAVVIFPRRSLEPNEPRPYRLLLNSPLVQRVYLNELGEVAETSIGVGIVQLIVESENTASIKARQLIEQAKYQFTDALTQQEIIEFIETVVIYKFPRLSREEVEAMLGLDAIRNTRVFQEAREEGKLEGKLEAIPEFLKLGLSLEQIAKALKLEIDVVRQAAEKQSS
ncbi:Rpn family recombination-promoting nuclease/putative transposase [Nostoc sp. CENA67]|uniref:Rpn family recombination-promoting nuclease/putative transposase n=1 Tax=Amazonocrinis nigriterrae CENA67 TaxID=2794033 RepID=A0A8J7L842_9NOST|nr:Rpn family recombination-promoting nuclease/putative transposase [Amazonocrinis nigriterrae CENA67]